jgi:hypothetical protein
VQDTIRVEPAGHAPCPAHAPAAHWQLALHVSISVPQFPQDIDRVLPGAQPSPEQLPCIHWQLELHVSTSVPQLPHATERVLPGAHAPPLAQASASPASPPSSPASSPRPPSPASPRLPPSSPGAPSPASSSDASPLPSTPSSPAGLPSLALWSAVGAESLAESAGRAPSPEKVPSDSPPSFPENGTSPIPTMAAHPTACSALPRASTRSQFEVMRFTLSPVDLTRIGRRERGRLPCRADCSDAAASAS